MFAVHPEETKLLSSNHLNEHWSGNINRVIISACDEDKLLAEKIQGMHGCV